MVLGVCVGVSIIFWVISVIFLVVAKNSANSLGEKKKKCVSETTATVIDIKEEQMRTSDGYSYTWYPVYEYTIDGEKMTRKSNIGNGKNHFEKGQQVTLYYNPDNSEEIYVPEENAESLAVFFKIMGIVFLIVGFIPLVLIAILWYNKVLSF